MTDIFTKEKRSWIMGRIKCRWTLPEKLVHNFLKGNKVRHKMHPNLPGKPDVLLTDSKTVIFVDGCFWHGCPDCYREPSSNVIYWKTKIKRNKSRAKQINMVLRKQGWQVVRIWGHEMRGKKCMLLRKKLFQKLPQADF